MRFRHAGEQLADRREQARVGGRVAARRAADGALVDADDLVEVLQALHGRVGRGFALRVVQLARHGHGQGVVDQRGLARAGHAGHADQPAGGDAQVHVLQVVAGGAGEREPRQLVVDRPALRNGDGARAAQVLAGERGGVALHRFGIALRHHLAAVLAGAGAHVHDPVGHADHVLVVLDHDHAVAQVAQVLQRADQAVVVALVQADGRLVQHVHDAGQARADLAGQPDALGLAAGNRVGAAVQRQVVQAHVVQEAQPRLDFAHDALRDLLLGAGQAQVAEPGQAGRQRHGLDFVDGLALAFAAARILADQHVAGLGPQARAAAIGAGLDVAVLAQLFAHGGRIGLAPAALQVRDHAFEGVALDRAAALFVQIDEGDLFVARTVQHLLAHVLGSSSNGASISNS